MFVNFSVKAAMRPSPGGLISLLFCVAPFLYFLFIYLCDIGVVYRLQGLCWPGQYSISALLLIISRK